LIKRVLINRRVAWLKISQRGSRPHQKQKSSKNETLLEKVYYSPAHEGSFSSASQLQRVLKTKFNVKIALDEINSWLEGQRSFTFHKRPIYKFKSNPIVAGYIDMQWEADIMFLPDLEKYNDGFNSALVCVDVVSKKAWIELMKSKTGPATAKAMTFNS